MTDISDELRAASKLKRHFLSVVGDIYSFARNTCRRVKKILRRTLDFTPAISIGDHEHVTLGMFENSPFKYLRIFCSTQGAHKQPAFVLAKESLHAIGSALIAHAHVRNFDAESRVTTAEIVAKAALEEIPGAVAQAGRYRHNSLIYVVAQSYEDMNDGDRVLLRPGIDRR